ncbi:hypothetical protein [Streptomyces sp. NPDC059168]|uniref:hypothetical protein n=1 Tax=Streptomyces sp. NPDC059168 TaxID=3346753 RepID=UPI003683338C
MAEVPVEIVIGHVPEPGDAALLEPGREDAETLEPQEHRGDAHPSDSTRRPWRCSRGPLSGSVWTCAVRPSARAETCRAETEENAAAMLRLTGIIAVFTIAIFVATIILPLL